MLQEEGAAAALLDSYSEQATLSINSNRVRAHIGQILTEAVMMKQQRGPHRPFRPHDDASLRGLRD